MIKRLTVRKLNDRSDFDLCFNEDMNILTGKNGCGKTTLLKLAWYMISGNLDRVAAEINFEYASITTDAFTLSASQTKETEGFITWTLLDNEGNTEHFPSAKGHLQGILKEQELGFLRRKLIEAPGASVFFPTFRRIEGGFAMNRSEAYFNTTFYDAVAVKIDDAMRELAERLSAGRHRFVTSISTRDIEDMLMNLYADIGQRVSNHNFDVSDYIVSLINDYNNYDSRSTFGGWSEPYDGDDGDEPYENSGSEASRLSQAVSVLDRIRNRVNDNSVRQAALWQPLQAIDKLVHEIFKSKGIQIAPNIAFGDKTDAVPSNILSAGEKQMLSFVVYNALAKNNVLFMDEPEISLHVDWQRTLFSTLESQGTNNQFIVATHSPFIYSKYPDKEILLDKDRGE